VHPDPPAAAPATSYDAVVVGGSWAGLAAAMQLARARRRVLVVDAGRPRNRFAAASHGFPGQDGRAPADIIDAVRAEVLAYPTAEFRGDDAVAAREDGDGFALTLASGTRVRARRLVLATGVVDELPDVPGTPRALGRDGAPLPVLPRLRGGRPPPRRARDRRDERAPGAAAPRLERRRHAVHQRGR
jgi:choline dehydrogenase-like flavoprotein